MDVPVPSCTYFKSEECIPVRQITSPGHVKMTPRHQGPLPCSSPLCWWSVESFHGLRALRCPLRRGHQWSLGCSLGRPSVELWKKNMFQGLCLECHFWDGITRIWGLLQWHILYTLRLWCIMTSMFAQVRKSLEAFMQSSKCMFDVHSFPAIRSLLVRWARSAARRWRRARGPSAKFPPTCSMPSWPESSEISSSEEVWRTASSVPWREQNNDGGNRVFRAKKCIKNVSMCFCLLLLGDMYGELSRLKFRIWKSCLEAA